MRVGRGGQTDGFVRLSRLEKDPDPSLGLPGMLRMENAPVRCWKASQPHCLSRMSSLGFNVLDSALPAAPDTVLGGPPRRQGACND